MPTPSSNPGSAGARPGLIRAASVGATSPPPPPPPPPPSGGGARLGSPSARVGALRFGGSSDGSGGGGGAGPSEFTVGAASTFALAASATSARDFPASAASTFALAAQSFHPQDRVVTALSGLTFAVRAVESLPNDKQVSVFETLILGPSATGHNTSIPAHFATSITFTDLAEVDVDALWSRSATASVGLRSTATATVAAIRSVSATTSIGLADRASANGDHVLSAHSGLALGASARQGRDLHVSATSGLGLGLGQRIAPLIPEAAHSAVAIASAATATRSGPTGVGRITFHDGASARVSLPDGGGPPGAIPARSFGIPSAQSAFGVAPSQSQGLRNLIRTSVSGDFPASFAETPSGLVLIANGVDPMLRWDGLGLADTAGVLPPTGPLAFGGVGAGTIVGERVAYQRFIDGHGNASILSPASNTVEFGTDGLIDSIACNPTTGLVTITSEAHGLVAGEPVVISGVGGMAQLNGTWTVATATADTFTLAGISIATNTATGGGTWTLGVASVVYSDVPPPAEAKVVRRQLLRNLAGNGDVFYVDIDTFDLASTTFFSSADDETLASREAVPLFFDDDLPQANRFYPPPSGKSVVASHSGRIFATADVTATRGCVVATFGSAVVTGTGTDFRATFAGRMFYVPGGSAAYEIASVDPAAQTITLARPFADSIPVPSTYAIRPPSGERKYVYYSEPNLPEAWPPWNAIAVPEDGDDITGLMVKDSFLYILESRHIYKYTLQSDPATDGFLFLSTRRGCLNNRCVAQVEGSAYLLDDVGIHRFDGGQSEAISMPIQPLFQRGVGLGGVEVNWAADRSLWHAALDPVRETIRWFVSMAGMRDPRHAICYDYRRSRWWVEEYPSPMTCGVVATIDYRRSLVGTDGARVLCLSEGTIDLADPGVGGPGTVTAAGPLSLSDGSASFPAGLAGAPVSISRGKGSGQQRRIVANDETRLEIDRPWRVRPDSTSRYQVGGIHWRWDSGWYRYAEDEYENPRDVELVFQPTRSDASMDIELFYDHAEAPRNWAYTASEDGVSTLDGSSRITVDLSKRTGYAIQRMSGHRASYADGVRFVSARLSGVQGPDAVRVYQVTLNGAE